MSREREPVSTSDTSGPTLLSLARGSPDAARTTLRTMSPEALARACQELRPAVRDEFLLLLDEPEQVVPLLEASEFVVTVRATGMDEGAWLLEMATSEQRVACIDLDCWQRQEVEIERVVEWIDGLIEAGRPTLLRALVEIDPEIWILALRRMTDIAVLGRDDEPPVGWLTEDGVVYWGPRTDADFARIRELAQATLAEAMPLYYQLVYGQIFELPSEIEEFALSWHEARMADLGFPVLEDAMRAYRPLSVEQVEAIDPMPGAARKDVGRSPRETLPAPLRGTLLARSLRALDPGRSAEILEYVLAVANTLAVADDLRLSEVESMPRSLAKAVRGIERGLDELSQARGEPPEKILDRTRPLDLFRIGATLDPTLCRGGVRGEEIRRVRGSKR